MYEHDIYMGMCISMGGISATAIGIISITSALCTDSVVNTSVCHTSLTNGMAPMPISIIAMVVRLELRSSVHGGSRVV